MKKIIILQLVACICFVGCVRKEVKSPVSGYSVSATVSNVKKDIPVVEGKGKLDMSAPAKQETALPQGYVKFIQADVDPSKDVFFKVRLFHKKEGKYYKVCNLGRIWKDSEHIDLSVPAGTNYFSFTSGDIDTYLKVEVPEGKIVPIRVVMSQGIVSRTITPYGSEVKKSYNLFADVLPTMQFDQTEEDVSAQLNVLNTADKNCTVCNKPINGTRFFVVRGNKMCTACRNKQK